MSRSRPRRGLNRPFARLPAALAKGGPAKPRPRPQVQRGPAPEEDADAAFRRAMAGVRPLPADPRGRVERKAPSSGLPPRTSEESEALAALGDLVKGAVHFDLSDTEEYLEGAVVGLDPRLVRRLRAGEFAWQGHLDLHGLTTAMAREAVERFLVDAVGRGLRCVLIVHGRGRNSPDQVPVLKKRLAGWLSRGRLARVVLAFTTARPCDGGGGAVYVLLRRRRAARRRRLIVSGGTPRC